MSQPSSAADLPVSAPRGAGPDPELEALPRPRRPGRRLTLGLMVATTIVALVMVWSLEGEARYALSGARPTDVGELAHFQPGPEHAGSWVRGEGLLAASGAIRYARPLEADTYRLSPVAGNRAIWVEVQVPQGLEGPHFVPPSSFVGRLVPVDQAGLRHRNLRAAVAEAAQPTMPERAWLLVDGEAPATTRWALGLVALFLAFAVFNLWGLVQLLRPVKDS